MRRAILSFLVFACLVGVTVVLFQRLPGALAPPEDQGYVFMVPILPPAASLDRTEAVTDTMTNKLMHHPAVRDVVTFAGFDLLSMSQKSSSGVSFISLKDWSDRTDPSLDARNLVGTFMGMMQGIREAIVLAFNPPPITGMSTTGGFEVYVQNRAGDSVEQLAEATNKLIAAAQQRPELTGLQTTFSASVPQYQVEVDREKAKSLNVPLNVIFETMQSTFGSLYVNDFTLFGRTYRVNLQSEAEFREKPKDLRYVFVRSTSGEMIPMDTLISVKRVVGPDLIERFNIFPAAKVMGSPAPGFSSGQAIAAFKQVAAESLPENYSLGFIGSAYQEQAAAGTATQAFMFGLLMVFLILAAQYERWSLPLAVILAVPFAVFGAVLAVWLRGLQSDVYFQIGLLTLIGLAAKNAILIVEFAVLQREGGQSPEQAGEEAARLRFRPIVMTSLAFILGCLPLALSTGAGSASRHSLGTGVIGGMLAATFIAIFFIPLLYKVITKLTERRRRTPRTAETPSTT